jgi:hypothetical protein
MRALFNCLVKVYVPTDKVAEETIDSELEVWMPFRQPEDNTHVVM